MKGFADGERLDEMRDKMEHVFKKRLMRKRQKTADHAYYSMMKMKQ